MNKLDLKKRAQVLACLVEGNSIRATVRMTGAAKNTVVKLLAEVGAACADYQDKTLRNLTCKRVQVDEIWSFVYAKAKNVAAAKAAPEGAGDVWTWTAICADTKLMVSWLVGGRDGGYAMEFIEDLQTRLASRVQLSSDGNHLYLNAVEKHFAGNVDYAQIVKIFGATMSEGQKRYSPAECIGARKERVSGSPDMEHVSTSFVERQNLTMRMWSSPIFERT